MRGSRLAARPAPGRQGLRLCGEMFAVCAALAALAPARADRPLSYRFEVGDCLLYERRATIAPLDGAEPMRRVTDQIEALCLERRGDEAFILLDLTRAVDGRTEPPRAVLLYFDMAGRPRWSDEIAARLDPLEPALGLFPVLPCGPQSDAGWDGPPDFYQRQWHCTSRGPDAERHQHHRIDFKIDDRLGVAEQLGQTRTGSFWFDPTGGLVTRLELDDRDRSQNTRTTVVAALRQRSKQPADWVRRRTDEAAGFLRALRHEDLLLQDVVMRPDDLPRTQQQLDRLWSAFKSDVDLRSGSPFLVLADGRRQQLRTDAEGLRQRADLGRRWLNQPARTWSLQDLAGRTITSEQTRKGVVIECFWSGVSEPSIRALESLRRLQAELTNPNRPVHVLCYNLDRDIEAARRAIERCGGGLTQILGGPLAEAESLPALPVVRVVDGAGIVRGLWIGWDPAYAAARDLAVQSAGRSAP